MLCIYHIADHDGKASGAIVKRIYPQIELIGLNHDMEIPYQKIQNHDKVIICDFCLPMEYMFELNKKVDLTWIDHHASVIEEYDKKILEGYNAIKGLRQIGTAACVLTWKYYYPQESIPVGLDLLGRYDIFNLQDARVEPFEYAMQSYGQNFPSSSIWEELLNNRLDIDKMISEGKRILDWINSRNHHLVRSMAFEAEIDGLRCICSNMAQGRSSFFNSLDNIKDYDVMINFYMNKKRRWNLSFYSSKKDIDVSKIASRYGGGGHKGAAGASSLSDLPDFIIKSGCL